MSDDLTIEDLTVVRKDPATLAWPATLPIEIAMRQHPVAVVCGHYGIDQAHWDRLRNDPFFRKAVREAVETLKKDGMRFKTKAQLQSEELLETSWALIHAPSDQVPPAVKADLIKFTVRAAGLDGSKDQAAAANAAAALQINLILG